MSRRQCGKTSLSQYWILFWSPTISRDVIHQDYRDRSNKPAGGSSSSSCFMSHGYDEPRTDAAQPRPDSCECGFSFCTCKHYRRYHTEQVVMLRRISTALVLCTLLCVTSQELSNKHIVLFIILPCTVGRVNSPFRLGPLGALLYLSA
jgi:hypothetical protein